MDALPKQILYFLVLSQKTAFFKLKDILPECFFYREASPNLDPLICLEENACHVDRNCMETLVTRLKTLFEEVVPEANLMVLYYKRLYRKNLGAGIFYPDLQNFRVITMNPYAWDRLKFRGNLFRFDPSNQFFLPSSQNPKKWKSKI